MWSSATGEVTFVAGTWQLPEKAFGQTINVKVYAVDSDGFKGEEVTENVLVPGGAPKVVNPWAMMHFSSQRAFDNPQTYRYGKSAHQIQFCHGGVRSGANPNDACFGMDVGGPWVTENAEVTGRFTSWRPASVWRSRIRCLISGIRPRLGVLSMQLASALLIRGTLFGSRTGVYTSKDKGATFTLSHNCFLRKRVQRRKHPQLSAGAQLRADRIHDIWYFLSPKYSLSKSTNSAVKLVSDQHWRNVGADGSGAGTCSPTTPTRIRSGSPRKTVSTSPPTAARRSPE